MRETMARLRPNPAAEVALAAIEGIDSDDLEWDETDIQGIADWLAVQRVGTVRVTSVGAFVDIERDELMVKLDKHPGVRAALSATDPSSHIDIALLRLGDDFGRPISQAVGVAVRESMPEALGIGYRSRLATDEPCWAIWETTMVDVTSVPLNPSDPLHYDAVHTVAAAYEIDLPSSWR